MLAPTAGGSAQLRAWFHAWRGGYVSRPDGQLGAKCCGVVESYSMLQAGITLTLSEWDALPGFVRELIPLVRSWAAEQ